MNKFYAFFAVVVFAICAHGQADPATDATGPDPFTGNVDQGFERNSRTFFVRVSYLFRKSM